MKDKGRVARCAASNVRGAVLRASLHSIEVCSGLPRGGWGFVVGFCCGVLLWFLWFSCFRVGMHALPLCGAAPTFLCAAKKSRQKKAAQTANASHSTTRRFWEWCRSVCHLAPFTLVTKGSFIPLRATRVAVGYARETDCAIPSFGDEAQPLVLVMPHGARSAAGRKSALSLGQTASDASCSGTTPRVVK